MTTHLKLTRLSVLAAFGILTGALAGGVLNKVGDLTLNGSLFGINNAAGFDITSSGNAFVSWQQGLYTIDLSSGALSSAGQIGAAPSNIIGLTSAANVPLPASLALTLVGLGLMGFSRKAATRASFQQH